MLQFILKSLKIAVFCEIFVFLSVACNSLGFLHIGPSGASTIPLCYCTPDGSQQHPSLPSWLQSWPQQYLWQVCQLPILPAHTTLPVPQRPECLPPDSLHLPPVLSRDRAPTSGQKAATVPGCLVSQPVPCDPRFWWSSATPQRQNPTLCWALCNVCVDVPALCL